MGKKTELKAGSVFQMVLFVIFAVKLVMSGEVAC